MDSTTAAVSETPIDPAQKASILSIFPAIKIIGVFALIMGSVAIIYNYG